MDKNQENTSGQETLPDGAETLDVNQHVTDDGGPDAPENPDSSREPDPQTDTDESLLDSVLRDDPDLAKSLENGDTLDITRPVVETAQEQENSESSKEPESTGQEETGDSDDSKSDREENPPDETQSDDTALLTGKELSRMSSNTRRKVKVLQEAAQRGRELEPHANAAQELAGFLQESNINTEDFQVLLSLGAALQKGDFKTFLDGVSPYVQIAQEATGIAIPADLQEQVLNGNVTEAMAKQFAQQRVQQSIQQENLQRQLEQSEQREADNRSHYDQLAASRLSEAVSGWESGIKVRDPDYLKKQPAVIEFTKSAFAENGMPKTPEEAVQVAEKAYQQVNDLLDGFRPARKPTAQSPSAVNISNTDAHMAPQSLMEAAMQGLRDAQV